MSTEIESNFNRNPRHNRKRKTVLLNARKYQKKGRLGRGSEIDSDTYDYFLKILETYRNGFESEDEKLLFANNALEQSENEEIKHSRHQLGCRVIETLLPYANDTILERFINKFGDDLRPLCSDEFAGFVVQALVKNCCKKSLITDEEHLKVEFQQKCKQFVLKVSKFLLNNLEDYIWDKFGNRIMRTCLECLAQIPSQKQNEDNRIKKDYSLIIPSEYEDVVKDFGERILAWPQFNELCNEVLTSGFLQVLLISLKQVDKKILKKYLKKLLDENFTTGQETDNCNQLPPVFLSKSLIMLLETSLQVAKGKMFTQIYLNCFLNRLPKLATTKATNYAVQKLIRYCEEETEFEAIFEELKNTFDQILNVGHIGVLLALCQGCKRFATKQVIFIQNLMKCFDCYEPEDRQNKFVICLLTCRKFDTFKNSIDISDKNLNLQCCLILETILEFNKPIKIVNGLLDMDSKSLTELFCKKKGSFITQAFFNGSFVGEKNREKLIKKLRGYYQDLASNVYGSRSFEDLWNAANLNNKLKIMAELADKDAIWSNTPRGRIIAVNINLSLYKRHKDQWKNSLNVGDKAKKLFDDVVE